MQTDHILLESEWFKDFSLCLTLNFKMVTQPSEAKIPCPLWFLLLLFCALHMPSFTCISLQKPAGSSLRDFFSISSFYVSSPSVAPNCYSFFKMYILQKVIYYLFGIISWSLGLVLLLLSCFSPVWPCDPIDGSPLGSPVPGILQARTLEWVAISFSNGEESILFALIAPSLIAPCTSPSKHLPQTFVVVGHAMWHAGS